jgi:hypothetical protein
VLIFLSGRLPSPEAAVGVTGLLLQVSTLVWLTAASISSATSSRIANALGRVRRRARSATPRQQPQQPPRKGQRTRVRKRAYAPALPTHARPP